MGIPRSDVLLAPYVTNWHARIATGFATYGLRSEQAAAFAAVYAPWDAAWTAMVASRSAGIRSESETSNKDSAKAQMLPVLRELYAIVQASRTVSDGDKHLLGVTVRSSGRAPLAAPGPLSNFTAEINGDGSLTIRWAASNPAGAHGTMYQVWRRVGAVGPLVYCGATGSKSYTDAAVPAGAVGVMYQVQAVRSTAVGPWTQFNVNFAAGGSGAVSTGLTVSASGSATSPKMAA
ncbi:MAG TPA: hypothetical protein VGN72_22740 [Tepidisphaeraceae bacterium]|nr:hypothetical protein [Tepidisphaeraceae bacterium]